MVLCKAHKIIGSSHISADSSTRINSLQELNMIFWDIIGPVFCANEKLEHAADLSKTASHLNSIVSYLKSEVEAREPNLEKFIFSHLFLRVG